MAIRIDAVTDLVSRNTGLPAFGSRSVMVWIMRVVDEDIDECVMYIANNTSFGAYIGCNIDGGTAHLAIDCNLGGTGGESAVTLGLDTWYHIDWDCYDPTQKSFSAFFEDLYEWI